MTLPIVVIRRGSQHRIENGHPWVYQTEVDHIEGDVEPGGLVDVVNHRNYYIGRGYINPRSKILVRLLTREPETIDRAFFRERLERAWRYRQKVVKEPEFCRLVFSEGDFLPGLIIDRFGDHFVLQTLALGIDRHKDLLVELLVELFHPRSIYERNDVPVRRLEGLPLQKGLLYGEQPPALVPVLENGLSMVADPVTGQKTGFFYDQRENRAFLAPFFPGASVLDCFCHTGSFAVHAATYGAKDVLAVDISGDALAVAKRNAEVNNVADRCRFEEANAFNLLREYSDEGKQFDVVILDPPAFTKSRSTIESAARGYKEINLRGLKLTKPGGVLVTCSCSYHMDAELFLAIVLDAARDVKRTVRQIEYRTQAKDHPILPASPETQYLKFLVLEVW
mgnify:CR=1 FL=1